MGQRLNIEILEDGKELANCYYHWSAYSSEAVELTSKIVDAYMNSTTIGGVKLAVEILESTGAGIDEGERARIANDKTLSDITFVPSKSRNDGLISVTEKGMNETRMYEEGRVTIDIGTMNVCFDVMWVCSMKEYENDAEENGVKAWGLRTVNFDFCHIPFNRIGDLKKVIEENPNGLIMPDGSVAQWIE